MKRFEPMGGLGFGYFGEYAGCDLFRGEVKMITDGGGWGACPEGIYADCDVGVLGPTECGACLYGYGDGVVGDDRCTVVVALLCEQFRGWHGNNTGVHLMLVVEQGLHIYGGGDFGAGGDYGDVAWHIFGEIADDVGAVCGFVFTDCCVVFGAEQWGCLS